MAASMSKGTTWTFGRIWLWRSPMKYSGRSLLCAPYTISPTVIVLVNCSSGCRCARRRRSAGDGVFLTRLLSVNEVFRTITLVRPIHHLTNGDRAGELFIGL